MVVVLREIVISRESLKKSIIQGVYESYCSPQSINVLPVVHVRKVSDTDDLQLMSIEVIKLL